MLQVRGIIWGANAKLKEAERDRDIATRAVVAMQTQRDSANRRAEMAEGLLASDMHTKGELRERIEQQTRALAWYAEQTRIVGGPCRVTLAALEDSLRRTNRAGPT